MAEGSGTRSSLLWEVKRLLTETEELPQLLMMENVPQVHSKKNLEEWNRWLEFLRNIGYTTYWQDMNAKDYGVAQSRNRTIAISILGNYSFEFPKPYPLEKTMKDYLEDVVDEKYYLTNDKAKKLIDQLIENGKLTLQTDRQTDRQLTSALNTEQQSRTQAASKPDMMVEFGSTNTSAAESVKSPSYLNYNRVDQMDVTEARTLMARDYKGFGSSTETQNGVIECQKI